MSNDTNRKMLEDACRGLIEHFDTVHIFATVHNGKTTSNINTGLGNWYARFGQIHEWREMHEQEMRDEAKRPPDD